MQTAIDQRVTKLTGGVGRKTLSEGHEPPGSFALISAKFVKNFFRDLDDTGAFLSLT
jgi:hypothetical protein